MNDRQTRAPLHVLIAQVGNEWRGADEVALLKADAERLAKALAPFVRAYDCATDGDARSMREGVGSYHFECAAAALAAHYAHPDGGER